MCVLETICGTWIKQSYAILKHRLLSVIVLWSEECRQPRGVKQLDREGGLLCAIQFVAVVRNDR